jgi:hypothetical protein
VIRTGFLRIRKSPIRLPRCVIAIFRANPRVLLCAAKDETSVDIWAECSVVISCGKVDYDNMASEAIDARLSEYLSDCLLLCQSA